jgi:hypothetical protein
MLNCLCQIRKIYTDDILSNDRLYISPVTITRLQITMLGLTLDSFNVTIFQKVLMALHFLAMRSFRNICLSSSNSLGDIIALVLQLLYPKYREHISEDPYYYFFL